MRVVALHRFPVKSMGGEALAVARIDRLGIEGDRRWMVVDAAGRFVTRRELPGLARIVATTVPGGVTLAHPEAGEIHLSIPGDDAPPEQVRIWRDGVVALSAGPAASDYLTALLGRALRLVYMADMRSRRVDPAFASGDDHVSFADSAPTLVTTIESLAALNGRLANPVTMARFRANIVVAGASQAWAEDCWRVIRIGPVTLRIVKPCARCVVTTQDPATGEIVDRHEPLATLRAMGRRAGKGIMFGQNTIPDGSGDVAVGDTVEILEAGESNLALLEKRQV